MLNTTGLLGSAVDVAPDAPAGVTVSHGDLQPSQPSLSATGCCTGCRVAENSQRIANFDSKIRILTAKFGWNLAAQIIQLVVVSYIASNNSYFKANKCTADLIAACVHRIV